MYKLFIYIVFLIFVGIFMSSCQKTASLPQAPDLSENQEPENYNLAKKNVIAKEKFVDNYEATLCPDNFPILRDCLTECIYLSGTINVVYNVFEDGSGGFHMHSQASNQNVKGVGLTTGTEYINSWNANWNHYFGELDWGTGAKIPPCKWHVTYRDHYVSKGNSPNFMVTWDMQIVINANGEMTIERDIMEVSCD